jgi:flagellar basal-body rod modification protein FlgD
MATTDAIGSNAGTTATTTSQTTQKTQNGTLGKDDFLKLMVAQLKNMDPMSASSSDPSQSMAQMAQFSMLEQLTNLSASTDQLKSATLQAQSLALVGKTVSWLDSAGNAQSGLVDSAQLDGGKVSLVVGGLDIDPADVTEVK